MNKPMNVPIAPYEGHNATKETSVMPNVLGVANRIHESIEQIAPAIARGMAMLNSVNLGLLSVASEIGVKLVADFGPLAKIDWAEAVRQVNELPAKSKVAMTAAARKGWFFGWNDSLQSVLELVEKIEAAGEHGIDQLLAQYYRDQLEALTHELVANHPHRAPAIRAAVNAHMTLGNDGYYLSIPVFIAQADGLLTEITKVSSAMTRAKGEPTLQASKALREQLAADPESLDLIGPLLNLHEHDFMKSAGPRRLTAKSSGETFTALNRHQVMHGESCDYGTETNSLRAFSLLSFVGTHLPDVLAANAPVSR